MLTLLLPGWRRQFRSVVRLRMILSAIALGSGLSTFILLVNRGTIASLESSVEDLAADNDLVVKALGGDSFPEDILDKVLSTPGVLSAVPTIQNKAFISFAGKPQLVTLLGLDLLNDRSLRKKESTKRRIADPLAFMANPDSIALTQAYAKEHHLQENQKVKMLTSLGPREYVVRALLEDEALGQAFGGSVVVMDLEASRRAYGKEGKIDKINLVAETKRQVPELTQALQKTLGEIYAVEPPSSQVQSLRELVAPFQKVLLFFGVLTSVMAFFLISSAAGVAIAERRPEVGVLRALGSTRGQILGAIFAEFLTLGLIGAGAGALAAWFLASYSLEIVQQGISSQTQALISLKAADLNPLIPFIVATLSALLTVLAALLPMGKISRVTPAEAFGALPQESSQAYWGRGQNRAVILIGVILLLPLLFTLPAKFAGLYGLPVLGIILLGPKFVVALLSSTRHAARLFRSPALELAWGYAVDKPARVENTVRALVMGLLLVFLITTVQDGFVRSLSQMFLNSSRPDFYVSSQGDFLSPMSLQPLDDSLQKELAKVEGVAGVFGQRIVTVSYQGKKIKLSAFDEVPPATLAVPYSYLQVSDRPIPEAGHELYHSSFPAAFVSESFATLFGKKTGDTILLNAEGKEVDFRIVGLVRDFTAGGGRIYLSRHVYKSFWHDSLVTGIAIVLAKGANLGEVRERVEKQFGPSHGILITVDRAIKGDVEKILEKSFASLRGIELACLLVAALGFLNAFLLEVRGRARELSLLRVIGMSRRELSFFLLMEAVLLGFSASLVSLILGVPVSWRIVHDGLPVLLGWVIDFSLRGVRFAEVFALGAGVALLASLAAIRWARGLDFAQGVKDE